MSSLLQNTPTKASQTRKAKPRQLAADSLAKRYALSIQHAKLIAYYQGYGGRADE